jgi:hypothetical protein
VSNRAQSAIGGPEACASHQCCSEKVDVHPPEAAAPEPALCNKRHRFVMGDRGNAGQRSQECQDFVAARESAAGQLSNNEIVAFGLTTLERGDERGLWAVKMVDPD